MKNILCLILSIVSLVLPVAAAGELTEVKESFAAVSGKVSFHRLQNGLRVLLYKRPIAPVFAGAVVVRVGSTDEPSGQTGISHLLEHMAFKGTAEVGTQDYGREKMLLAEQERLALIESRTGNLTAEQKARWEELNKELGKLWVTDQFSREYEKRGAAGMNATTDTELTRYFVNLPRSAFEFWCYMESERLAAPVLRQFYSERDVVLEERRMRYEDDPGGKLYELTLGTVFRVHPYHNPTIGYSFDLRRLTATHVDDFRRKFYVPGNIVLALVGDIQPEQDLAMIDRYFGRLPAAPLPERQNAVEPPQEGERSVILEERSAPQIEIAYRKVQYPHPDDPPISVMLKILADSRISPLYTELVKKRQIATAIGSDEGPGFAYPNFMLFSATPRTPHTTGDVLKAFDGVVRKFKRNPVPQADLETAQRALAVEYLNGFKSNQALALHLAGAEAIYNDWKAPFDWFEKAMAVTTQDVARVANQYLVERARSVLVIETRPVKR